MFPNASAVDNKLVLLHYFKTFEILQANRMLISVAWCGQLDKHTDLDADDLLVQAKSTGLGSKFEESVRPL